jgi:hypothetical protein
MTCLQTGHFYFPSKTSNLLADHFLFMKKNLSFIVSLLIMLFLFSCQSAEELLVGKWKFHRVDVIRTAQHKNISPRDTGEISSIENILKGTTFEFMKDGSFERFTYVDTMEISIVGTYELSKDGESMILIQNEEKGETSQDKCDILLLTKDSLIFRPNTENLVVAFSREGKKQ